MSNALRVFDVARIRKHRCQAQRDRQGLQVSIKDGSPDRLQLQDLKVLTPSNRDPVIRLDDLKPQEACPQGRRDHEEPHDRNRHAGFLRRRQHLLRTQKNVPVPLVNETRAR